MNLTSCENDYIKYADKPDYITNPQPEYASFFKAYDASLKLWDVPFEELYIPTSYGTAHVIVSGERHKESVVLLHGMNASSTMWYPNIKALSENYRVFAIDFILEPGKSFISNEIENLDQINSWYQEIFTKLKLKKFHLIGASRGGWLAVNMALRHQENIQSMVLLSPAQTFIWIRPSTNLLKNIIHTFSSNERQVQETLESMSSHVDNISKTYIEQYEIANEKDSINKFVVDMMPFSKQDFKSLKMPVLVLIGDDDMINNKKSIRLAKELIPNGQAKMIKNAGHFLSIDQAEMVNKDIVEFLKNN
ncbi:alpha/beta fold hydrolase [Xanthomarina sp. GH4-25]|uniref:alpha/beta fold hydrolase n=1 Tax=Xanthomarina sp. GH4-25 TaxID=3349335 RepID=UPI003877C55D